ncbi:MAG: CDP-diacylglycerol--glycerol-3-phosphate 3-phosphatidyltransferase [Gammaproteobacteria bacterium]|nr:CDP-diacylglycerol--glycerol-3-phosphate 3-phosphatidyltransferase [Gammaproteobacteria bacterium]
MNLPIALTSVRIAVIPLFVFIFYLPAGWSRPAAALVFGLACLTDWLDGYMARRLGQITAFGAFLDPVADKLMIAVALVLLVQSDPSIFVGLSAAIIIGREITVSALREWMAESGARQRVAVSVIGKVKTIMQMVGVGFMLYQLPLFGLPVYDIGVLLLIAAAALTLWSMVLYLRAAWPAIADQI